MEHAKRRGASDFAGKEAVVKAFGTGFAGIDACEVEILRRESGAPYVTLYGAARKKQKKWGLPIGRFLSQIQRKLRRHL